MKEKIYILEGGYENDFAEHLDDLKEKFDCTEITNLYEEPEKLRILEDDQPWGIFIGTTGIGHELERKELRRIFKSIDYIPHAIIFATELSAMTYLDIAKDLKKHYGTISYFASFIDGSIREIEWI